MTALSDDRATFNVAILVYEGVEELDFCGPFETLKAAANVAPRLSESKLTPWQVFTVSQEDAPLKTSGGLTVHAHHSFDTHPPIDLLVIPGGWVGPQVENTAVVEWIDRVTKHAALNTSVCNGAFLLGAVGLLDGHRATTHWNAIDRLTEQYPNTEVLRDVRWVDEGPIVTAAGISAGIDMSLHLVDRLLGREVAETVAKYMEYEWRETGIASSEPVEASVR